MTFFRLGSVVRGFLGRVDAAVTCFGAKGGLCSPLTKSNIGRKRLST
jgi:hypothetical protein